MAFPDDRSACRRRLVLGTATLVGLGRAARAAEPGVGDDRIVVGQSITLQGGRNLYAAQVQAGVAAALEDLHRGGGLSGRRVELRTLDDANDTARAEANARRLVADGAFVLFGSLEGGPSTAVMKAALDLRVPFIGPMAGSPGLRRPHQPLVFPVRAEHREEFRALMEHGRSLGLARVALFHADSDVGREHLGNVERLAMETGLGFGGGAPFRADITDEQLGAVVASLAGRRVDLVLNHGSPGVYERLIRRAREAGSRASYWAVNSGSTSLAAALGPLAHGMVFSQIVPNPRSAKTALVRDFRRHLGTAVPAGTAASYGALEGYLTARTLVAALRAAGSAPTRASLLKGLETFDLELGGVTVRYRPGRHTGSSLVDLALVGRDGQFIQ